MLNQHGIASAIAGNWQLTTTALARTGFPVECAPALELHRGGWGLRHAAARPGSGRISDSAGRQERRRVDQSCRLCNSCRRIRHRAAQPAARAGNLADRPGRRQDHFLARARANRIPLRVLQHLQSSATRSAAGCLQPIQHHRLRQHHQYGKPEHGHRIAHHPGWFRNTARDAVRAPLRVLEHFHRSCKIWVPRPRDAFVFVARVG